MKDSQPFAPSEESGDKYIKESNERFSTVPPLPRGGRISISRRVMKDSQHHSSHYAPPNKYIKESNERFSTRVCECVHVY